MMIEVMSILAGVLLCGVAAEQGAASAPYPAAAPYPAPAPAPYPPAAPVPSAPAQAPEVAEYPEMYHYQFVPLPEQPGLKIESGFEGVLAPQPQPVGHGLDLGLLALLKLVGWKLLPKAAPLLVGFALLLLLGGAFTTAVCTLTPFCSLTFPFGRTATNTVRGYLTPDRLTQTTAFVLDAIDKYKELTKRVAEEKANRRRR